MLILLSGPFSALALDLVGIPSGGMTRSYHRYVPASLPAGARPLVIALHPSFSNSLRFRDTASAGSWDTLADSEGFFVVYPNGTDKASYNGTGPSPKTYWDANGDSTIDATNLVWNSFSYVEASGMSVPGPGVDDIGFLAAVIDDMAAHYDVDRDRVYVTGFSNGAMMANTLAIARSDLIAASGPVSGGWADAYAGPTAAARLWPMHPVPTWIWRGSNEDSLPQTGSFDLDNGGAGDGTAGTSRAVQDANQRGWWVSRNQTLATPILSTGTATSGIQTRTLNHERYTGGWRGMEVRYTTVVGTSHQWQPGATENLWPFFKQYSRANTSARGQRAWQFGGSGDEVIRGASVDFAGTWYLAGTFRGTATFAGVSVTSASMSADDIAVAAIGADGVTRWVRTFGGVGDEKVYDIVVDDAGRVALTGWFSGTVAFGSSNLVATSVYDTFTAVLNPTDGQAVWATATGATSIDGGNEIAPDGAGGLLVVGNSFGAFANPPLPNFGSQDANVLAYTGSGALRWAMAVGGAGNDQGRGIAGDDTGGGVVAVSVTGSVTITKADGTTMTSEAAGGSAGNDILLIRFAANGSITWTKRYGGTGDDYPRGIGFDGNGNVVLSSVVTGAVDFGGTSGGGAGNTDIAFVKLAADGSTLWVRTLGGSSSEEGAEIEVQPDGSLWFVADTFSSTITQPSSLLTDAAQGGRDLLFGRLLADGTWSWLRRAGGTGNEVAYALAVNRKSDAAMLVGTFQNTAVFPGSGGNLSLRSVASNDAFAVVVPADPNDRPALPSISLAPTLTVANGAAIDLSPTIDSPWFGITGTGLQSGWSVDAITGRITGTGSTSGTFNVTLTATNEAGSSQASTAITVLTLIDTWRLDNFGIASNTGYAADNADRDGDGLTNAQEYVLGTNPKAASSSPLAITASGAGTVLLTFTAMAASGTGYAGLTRVYDVETTTDLANAASWRHLSGYTGIIGSDQIITITQPVDVPGRFFRLNIRLQQ